VPRKVSKTETNELGKSGVLTAKSGRKTGGGGYVAYYRVSDPKQGISRLGLEAQRESVERYLEHAKGTLIAEYTEIETGKHARRPQLQAAIAASKKHGATLLIAKLDRLARNVHFISGLLESAADFVAVDMPQANKLTIHIMAAMAEHEREMISERTKAGLAQIQKQIQETGSHTVRRNGQSWEITKLGNPRWQECIAKARLARHPKRAAVHVADLITRYRSEGESLRSIAARLNALGLKTPGGAAWHPYSVSTQLKAA
jgi:DNA invertase Pin-like site-specific DNA recombinase